MAETKRNKLMSLIKNFYVPSVPHMRFKIFLFISLNKRSGFSHFHEAISICGSTWYWCCPQTTWVWTMTAKAKCLCSCVRKASFLLRTDELQSASESLHLCVPRLFNLSSNLSCSWRNIDCIKSHLSAEGGIRALEELWMKFSTKHCGYFYLFCAGFCPSFWARNLFRFCLAFVTSVTL